MAFEIDHDRPHVPGIARILSILSILLLIFTGGLLLGAFSGIAWINPDFAYAGSALAFVLLVVMVGQAKTIELLSAVSARVKSQFALESALHTQPAKPAASSETKLPPATPTQKERVISIPEEVAREQGLTRAPREPRVFG